MVFVVLALVCLSVQAVISAPYEVPEGVNIDQILENDRLSTNYAECLLDKKPCSPEGQKLKDAIPEALKTSCKFCDEKNKADIKKVISHYKSKKPELWTAIVQKYDPDGAYKTLVEDLFKD